MLLLRLGDQTCKTTGVDSRCPLGHILKSVLSGSVELSCKFGVERKCLSFVINQGRLYSYSHIFLFCILSYLCPSPRPWSPLPSAGGWERRVRERTPLLHHIGADTAHITGKMEENGRWQWALEGKETHVGEFIALSATPIKSIWGFHIVLYKFFHQLVSIFHFMSTVSNAGSYSLCSFSS